MIERKDPRSCGSGRKYKKCSKFQVFLHVTKHAMIKPPNIKDAPFSVLIETCPDLKENGWATALNSQQAEPMH